MKYLPLLLLTGCAQLPADPSKMSAEQIKEWVRDKNASISCGKVNTPYGPTLLTYVIFEGQVVVSPDCQVTITNDSRKVK